MTDTRLHIAELLNDGWKKMTFEPFREGVEICLLHDGSLNASLPDSTSDPVLSSSDAGKLVLSDQPSIALLRYAAGASVPRHRHTGVETIIVLEGSQSDEQDTYQTGSVVINPVGSEHSVWSNDGCVVLIQWDKPVAFF